MEEEKSIESSVNDSQADTKSQNSSSEDKPNETIDDKVNALLGDYGDVEETPQETPEEPEKEETPKQEEKEKEVIETPQVQPQEPSRLDKRVAKLYNEVLILSGNDSQDIQDIVEELKFMPLEEKKQALQNLFAQRSQLRGQENQPLPQEDSDALIEAEVERRFEFERQQIEAKEREVDLVKTYEAHPELDPSHKDYNPTVNNAIEKLYMSGMRLSEAYDLVKGSIEKAVQEAKNNALKEKQKSLSGTLSASPQGGEPTKEMTPEELRIEQMMGSF